MNSTLQIRINKETKKRAQKVFNQLGLDISSGVKLYLSQVVRTGSIPFVIKTKNGFTKSREKELLKETKNAIRKKGRYQNARLLHRSFEK